MPNQKNIQTVENIKKKLSKANSLILTEYHGLDANQVNNLRAKISETDAEIHISKNTLVKCAMQDQNMYLEKLETHLEGPTAVVYAYGDYLAPIKALFEFAKNLELPKIKAAILEGKFTSAEQIETLGNLPPKEVLLAQVVGGLKTPLTNFVNVLGGSQRKLVYALSAVAEAMADKNAIAESKGVS